MCRGGRKQAPGPPTWAGAVLRCTRWHTVGRVIPGGLRPRRARFRFTRRTNRNKTTTEEQEQTSVAVANGLAPRSIHLAPGGPLLLADVGPFCLPITKDNWSRLKGRPCGLTPLYLQYESRILGLVLLLSLALRLLTVLEWKVRKELQESGQTLRGLHPGQ